MSEPETTAPGWRDLIVIHISLSKSGLWAAVAGEPCGMLVTGHSLSEVLSGVPLALRELKDAGAAMPRLDGVDLS